MFRACELKDQTYKKTRTLHFADSAAIRIRIRIAQCQRSAKREKHKPCETQARCLPPLLLVGSKESVLKVPKRGQFHAVICATI